MNKREKPERRFKVKESGDYNDNLIFNQACVQWEAFYQQEIARLEAKYDKLSKLRDDEMARHISEVARLEKEKQDLNNGNFKLRAIACKQSGELARIKGISVEEIFETLEEGWGGELEYDMFKEIAKQIHSLIQGGGK